MQRLLISLFIITITSNLYAQSFEYKMMQTGTIKIDDDDSRNLDGLSILLWIGTQTQANSIMASQKLSEELKQEQPNPEEVKKWKDIIKEWEEYSKENRIGREEQVNCSVEYIIDSQNKLKIVGKTTRGDILFEFGKGHNQQFFLYPDEDKNKDFYIGVFDNGGKGLIGIIEQNQHDATIYIGDIKHSDYFEFIQLYVMPRGIMNSNGEYTPTFNANENSLKRLMPKILSIFPKDKDGDRWMLCK